MDHDIRVLRPPPVLFHLGQIIRIDFRNPFFIFGNIYFNHIPGTKKSVQLIRGPGADIPAGLDQEIHDFIF